MAPPSGAVATLKETLVRQFGAPLRDVVEAEVEARLVGRTRLERSDLDSIERGILAARRQRRSRDESGSGCHASSSAPNLRLGASPAARSTRAVAGPSRPVPPLASELTRLPSLKSRGQTPLAQSASASLAGFAKSVPSRAPSLKSRGQTPLAQSASAGSVGFTKSVAAGAPYVYPLALGRETASLSARSTVHVQPRYPVPLPMKSRAVGLWDYKIRLDYERYVAEENKESLEPMRRARFKATLDSQMIDISAIRDETVAIEREEADLLTAQLHEERRLNEEDQCRSNEKKAMQQRMNTEMRDQIEQRKLQEQEEKRHDCEEMNLWLGSEKQRLEADRREQKEYYAQKCAAAKECLENARAERARQKGENDEYERRVTAEGNAVRDAQDAAKAKAVAKRNAHMDLLASTVGAEVAQRGAEDEAGYAALLARNQEWADKLIAAENARKGKEHARHIEDTEAYIKQQRQAKADQDRTDKEEDRRQAAKWRKQHEDGLAADESERLRRRKAREEQDVALIGQMRETLAVHPMEVANTPRYQRTELAYNRRMLEQVVEKGGPDAAHASALLEKADDKGRLGYCLSVGPYDGPIHELEMEMVSQDL